MSSVNAAQFAEGTEQPLTGPTIELQLLLVVLRTSQYLWSEVECRLDVLMLCPWRSPWVIEFETLIAEIGPAVSTALGGFQSLRRLTKLAHHSHTAQTHCVSVPLHYTLQGEVTQTVS